MAACPGNRHEGHDGRSDAGRKDPQDDCYSGPVRRRGGILCRQLLHNGWLKMASTDLSAANKRVVKRLGVVVNHRRMGYQANAMVVFDVPNHLIDQIGGHISQFGFVNLCYQRPRHAEQWPFNLYCMIHGKNREKVLQQLEYLIESCGLVQFDREILFSRKCFKQRGAVYQARAKQENISSDG